MKKINQTLFIALLAVATVACSNNETIEKKSASYELKEYVDSMKTENVDYTPENWVVIDNGYRERALKAEAKLANMTEEEKVAVEASKKKYADLSEKYAKELNRKTTVTENKVRLRNTLFGEGKVGVDMTFSFANARNLLGIYQTFVSAVDENKDTYTREDWDEIKLLYEALDTRKNVVEKELAEGMNRKISALKVKFSVIYDTNRPGSKARENAEAKS